MSETTNSHLAAEPWRLSDQELTAALTGQEALLRREHACLQVLVGELLRRGPGAVPYRGPVEFFREELHWSRREARERMAQAEATQPGRGVAGEPTRARWPPPGRPWPTVGSEWSTWRCSCGSSPAALVLLCSHHHRVIHHTEGEVRLNPTDQRPEFLPPARLDPQRKPLRNTAHHILTRADQAHRRHRHPPGDDPWRHTGGCTTTRTPRAPATNTVA